MRLFDNKVVIEKSDTCDLVYTFERKSLFFPVRKYACVFEFYSFLDVKTPENTVLHTARRSSMDRRTHVRLYDALLQARRYR